jgi:murein DD-endopeptidase MepM/ murein hydrolase activator NlpD
MPRSVTPSVLAAGLAASAALLLPSTTHAQIPDAGSDYLPATGKVVSGPLRVHPAPARPRHSPLEARTGAFPVAAEYDFGTSENAFGGGRGHQGQDILTYCGGRVVAARAGKVTVAKWHAAAGNFAVVRSADGTNQVYMHLLRPARVGVGDRIEDGERIGTVGQTGRASTCHLHFEQWTAPGWYEGGHPVDPRPLLRRLAR